MVLAEEDQALPQNSGGVDIQRSTDEVDLSAERGVDPSAKHVLTLLRVLGAKGGGV
jgi:hypothetical protein